MATRKLRFTILYIITIIILSIYIPADRRVSHIFAKSDQLALELPTQGRGQIAPILSNRNPICLVHWTSPSSKNGCSSSTIHDLRNVRHFREWQNCAGRCCGWFLLKMSISSISDGTPLKNTAWSWDTIACSAAMLLDHNARRFFYKRLSVVAEFVQ